MIKIWDLYRSTFESLSFLSTHMNYIHWILISRKEREKERKRASKHSKKNEQLRITYSRWLYIYKVKQPKHFLNGVGQLKCLLNLGFCLLLLLLLFFSLFFFAVKLSIIPDTFCTYTRFVYLDSARECTLHSDCSGIPLTSCVRDGPVENKKMRCLCGNNKPPRNGHCEKSKKRKLLCIVCFHHRMNQ